MNSGESEKNTDQLILNEEHFEQVLLPALRDCRRFLWLITADLKDVHVPGGRGRKFQSFLTLLDEKIRQGVEVRLMHAKAPGPRFTESLRKTIMGREYTPLWEQIHCPRIHSKIILVDGKWAYIGSANLTGAALGSRHPDKRNWETGIVTYNPEWLGKIMASFDEIYCGIACESCRHRDICPAPRDD